MPRGLCNNTGMNTNTTTRTCLNGPSGCLGPVTLHPSLAGTGTMIPRCDAHYAIALEAMEKTREIYPDSPIAPIVVRPDCGRREMGRGLLMLTAKRNFRGRVYHVAADNWITSGLAVCGASIASPAFTTARHSTFAELVADVGRARKRVCDHCTNLLDGTEDDDLGYCDCGRPASVRLGPAGDAICSLCCAEALGAA